MRQRELDLGVMEPLDHCWAASEIWIQIYISVALGDGTRGGQVPELSV